MTTNYADMTTAELLELVGKVYPLLADELTDRWDADHATPAPAEGQVTVDRDDLHAVLSAIGGPPHLIREMLVVARMSPGDGPINKLIGALK